MSYARLSVLAPTLWAILACGNGMPVDLGQEFRAPMEDPPEAPRPDFPAAAALDTELEAELNAHLELLFHSESGEGPICEALEHARRLTRTLEHHLDSVASQNPKGFASAVTELDRLIPGVALRLDADGVTTWHAPGQLATYTDGNSAALLEAASAVLPHPDPGWMEPDGGGCSEPARIAEPLGDVATRWSLATDCVRQSLKRPLRDTLRDMARADCFCRARTPTMRDAEALEHPLNQLPDLGGAVLATTLTRTMSDPDARFEGTCSE